MADNNQVIGATINVDATNANANIKELKGNLKDVKGSLGDVGATAKVTGKDIDVSGGSFKNLKEQMTALPGPLGKSAEGVNKLGSSFKALLANPVVLVITAIVGALALLYKAFTNTFEGAQKVEQIFSGIKAAAQALFDNIGHLASALVKFFTFDFSGAVEEIALVVNAATDAYTAMSKLTEQAQKLHQEQLKNDLEQAERQKQLAILREQATDESVPIAKRKAALLELKDLAEKNAKDDVDLAKRTAENKIAQLTLEKDGALKNQDEINEIKIKAVGVETENANELRRIGKQITAANKQEIAERKEAEHKAAEETKKRRQELVEFTNKLSKLQQENELLTIKDGYAKELKALENKIAEEKKANLLSLSDKKINRQQLNQLNDALDIQANLQRDALTEKHNKEIADKEAAFQKELGAISQRVSLAAITDTRERERVELNIGFEQKLNDAIKTYKDDNVKLQAIREALAIENRAAQDKLDEKFKLEDEKKAFENSKKNFGDILSDPKAKFAEKQAAIDAEQQQVQAAFDNKVITEQQYNDEIGSLADARMMIRQQEFEQANRVASGIANAFDGLAEIAGKQTVLGKGLAIASTTIKTFQGAIAAFTGMTETIPGPVGIALGVVAAAGAVAAGIAAVKKIVAVQIPGQGSGGGSVPTGLPAQSAPIAPTQQGTKIDTASLNGIGNAAANGVNGRTYVLESDGANARDRAERLRRAAILGG